MGLLLTTEPKLRRNLQIEVVIDFTCSDDVVVIQFATCDKTSHHIESKRTISDCKQHVVVLLLILVLSEIE